MQQHFCLLHLKSVFDLQHHGKMHALSCGTEELVCDSDLRSNVLQMTLTFKLLVIYQKIPTTVF
jgi:hypothetical protein